MFVASRVYNYATGASSSAASADATPADTRVKRHPRRQPTSAYPGAAAQSRDDSASKAAREGAAATASSDEKESASAAQHARSSNELAKMKAIDEIVLLEDLYDVLGVKRNAKIEDIRRGFLNKSRICHPDKLPNYPPCVVAFQKVSFAYQTLSKPSSRRMYDVSGRSDLASALNDSSPSGFDANGMANDETLNSVLYSVFCEFLEGDFEMIRVLVNALNEGNPGLNLGEEAVDSIEGAFRRLRGLLVAGRKYLKIVRFELIRLYEIQHSLRQLSYFDVFGRLRLTLQLARVTLSIPMAIDQAMKEADEDPQAAPSAAGASDDVYEQQEARRKQSDADAAAAAEDLEVETSEADHSAGSSSDSDSEATSTPASAAQREERRRRRRQRHHQHRSQRRRKASVEDFGMRADDDDENDDDGIGFKAADDEPRGFFGTTNDEHARRAGRKSQRRARIKEQRQRAKLEAQEAAAAAGTKANPNRGGLLGPTASGLLKGVVKVLETSESWVPGGNKAAAAASQDDEKVAAAAAA